MDEARVLGMIRTMAEMQDSHNRHVHPDWLSQGYEYYRAVWVECAELLDHFGWKWWKKQESDLDQVKLEVVDIWHFGMSDLIRAGTLDAAAPMLLRLGDPAPSASIESFRLAVESLAEATLRHRAFAMEPFADVLEALPLPFTELFDLYVGKNVLNNFRQDHGYKTGEYLKLWGGREDNQHLMDALAMLDCSAEAVPAELYRALAQRYPGNQG
jgi:hypothetical protein